LDPEAFLTLAAWLADDKHAGEADYRTAAGRAYYAAFHVARDRLSVSSANSIHLAVIAAVHGRNVRAGSDLNRLRRYRTSADYSLDVAFEHSKCKEALSIAKSASTEFRVGNAVLEGVYGASTLLSLRSRQGRPQAGAADP
jgi:uncharacterized protein (UPF0332 family)